MDFRIFGEQPVREYTTQYNETDLDFAHRLLQESGYSYFFEHATSGHTLVITDANQAFKTLQEPDHRVVHNGDNVEIFNRWVKRSKRRTAPCSCRTTIPPGRRHQCSGCRQRHCRPPAPRRATCSAGRR